MGGACKRAYFGKNAMRLPPGYSHLTGIGGGAFSTVYRAWQKKLDRYVACKVIPLSHASRARAVEHEVRTLAAVRLSCVPAVFDVVRGGRQITVVMEWVSGVPLSVLADFRLSTSTRSAIATGLVHALSRLHGAGVIHRDLKPSNVIATPDRGVMLVDFGFSHIDTGNAAVVQNPLQGTPAFMAPELWSGNTAIDYKKTDLFALGVLLKDLLGPDYPAAAMPLLAADPALRPLDGTAFERDWIAAMQPVVPEGVIGELRAATAEYTAGLLFTGARELYRRYRREEAYTLLTESLEAWPDNAEALDFLQSGFSRPGRTLGRRRIAVWGAAAGVALAALSGGFIVGRHSLPQVAAGVEMAAAAAAGGRGERVRVESGYRDFVRERLALRDIAVADGLAGRLSIALPEEKGTLTIDGIPVAIDDGHGFSGMLPAGTHRIEWMDGARSRVAGETVEVLPFCIKKISLQRFTGE
jgi:hypothetical protein